ncbi:ribonuclease H-like domain-containing protein [Crucibulum laeve]|uniref:Ribonuclease H-like domain-containing protein n=1 Tax=Crucibulum laeve TaxID=68775 RepID=A0A5C3MC39_9AGAR|nr:ribonuclease H-like domain-containing protein [Crucibulum laeve]
MRYPRHVRIAKKKKALTTTDPAVPNTRQPYDMFLVLDVEATCHLGTDFNYANEIIEFPVCLMQWMDKAEDGTAATLKVIDEFRTFVRPTWRPTLSSFCTELTGITQEQVDEAPPFADVLDDMRNFMVKHGLIDPITGQRVKRFCWCSDGPFDIRDFVVKQCFISRVPMPDWIQGDVLDVRMSVMHWLSLQTTQFTIPANRTMNGAMRRSLNIPAQLKALGLPSFEGRQHSGIDDTRNIAKIITELARRGLCLQPNTAIYPGRRWQWMGKRGQILEEHLV